MDRLSHAQELACDAWQLISNHPDLHEQGSWRSTEHAPTRCGTKLCWGGHVVALDDGIFITSNPSSVYYEYVLARPTDRRDLVNNVKLGYGNDTIGLITIKNRLKSLFGIADSDELNEMTNGYLSVDEIRRGIIEVLGVDPRTRKLVRKTESPGSCYCGRDDCPYN